MKKHTPNVATHLLTNPEKYLLKIGGILRKLSLDELPNLINIIKGEMLFVGPRPALYNQKYNSIIYIYIFTRIYLATFQSYLHCTLAHYSRINKNEKKME